MNFHALASTLGNDSLEYAKHSNKHLDIDIFHFDGQTGYKSESIDIIFSKSFVEHIQIKGIL